MNVPMRYAVGNRKTTFKSIQLYRKTRKCYWISMSRLNVSDQSSITIISKLGKSRTLELLQAFLVTSTTLTSNGTQRCYLNARYHVISDSIENFRYQRTLKNWLKCDIVPPLDLSATHRAHVDVSTDQQTLKTERPVRFPSGNGSRSPGLAMRTSRPRHFFKSH